MSTAPELDPGAVAELGARLRDNIARAVKAPDSVIRDVLGEAGHPFVEAQAYDDDTLDRVHSRRLTDHLRRVHDAWLAAGFVEDPGQDRVVPYVFPTAAMLGGIPMHPAGAVHGRAGEFCYDTMTLVGRGTWEAARAAVDCGLTAAHRVLDGEHAVYALCRPPDRKSVV